ncbi:MAG: M67 family metallopeptidase [Sphingomonas sp.]
MGLRISRAVLGDILRHVAATPDHEACGLLFGDADHIRAAAPAANVSDRPAAAFEIDPAALFAAMRAERAGGPPVIGHYHSHPSGDAMPSPRDAAAAADPGRLWLIVADGRAACFRAERGGPIHDAFRAVPLDAAGDAGCIADAAPPERPPPPAPR